MVSTIMSLNSTHRLMDSPYGDLLAAANGTRIAAPTPDMMKLIHKQGFKCFINIQLYN